MREPQDGYIRNRPRTLSGQVGSKERTGYDLSDVLRDLVLRTLDMQSMDQKELAEALGVAPSTVSRFLAGQSPMKSTELTKLCFFLDQSPISLFASHPVYFEDARAKVRFPKDYLYERFNRLLQNADARATVNILDEADRLGVLSECLAALRATVETAKRASQKARRPRTVRRGRRASQARVPERSKDV